jgi:hypothetical protein
VSAIGSTALTALSAELERTPPRPLLDTICGFAVRASEEAIMAFISSTRRGPQIMSTASEAISTMAAFTSWLLATWPFLRASDRRLGVAFSVLSPAPCAI